MVATLPDMRTRHGIVQYRTTADGTPVAVVSERSTYGHEVDSALGFAQMNDPAAITSAGDFIDAFSKVRTSPSTGSTSTPATSRPSPPGRCRSAPRASIRTCRAGATAKWDWTGFLPASQHPQSINPPSGYLVSWNNKPTVGTYSADDEWGWGPVQRVLALQDRVKASIKKASSPARTWTADMIDAATVDVRGAYVLPDMLAVVGDDPELKPYTDLLQKWMASGAHRVDRERTGHYTDQAAVALMDAWYPLVAKQVVPPRLGSLVAGIPDSARQPPGSGAARPGTTSAPTNGSPGTCDRCSARRDGAMSQKYCGKGVLATCQKRASPDADRGGRDAEHPAADERPRQVDLRQVK